MDFNKNDAASQKGCGVMFSKLKFQSLYTLGTRFETAQSSS